MKQKVRHNKSNNKDISDLDFIRHHKAVLENLYGTEFLDKYPPKHPAQTHYQMCLNILEKGGMIKWNESQEYYHELLRMTQHTSVTNTIGQGSTGILKIGDIALYGDELVQRKLKACLKKPQHFNSLMLELSFASYQINKENIVLPLEQENKPDIRVEVEELDLPVYVECKCLESISENRLNSRIKKANKQIKNVEEDCYGLVVIDITDAISQTMFRTNTDNVPKDVQDTVDIIQKTVSGKKNTRVSKVIVKWSKSILLEDKNQKCLFLEENSIEVNHDAVIGTRLLPENIKLYEGETYFIRIIISDRKSGIKKLVFSDSMKMCQEKFNFSNEFLVDCFMTSDKIQRFNLDNKEYLILFATKIKRDSGHEYILECGRRKDDELLLHFVFRLPSKIYNEVRFISPLEMLSKFLEYYGLEIAIDLKVGKLIEDATINLTKTDPSIQEVVMNLIKLKNPDDHDNIISTNTKITKKPKQMNIQFKLSFAVDTTLLLQDLNSKEVKESNCHSNVT